MPASHLLHIMRVTLREVRYDMSIFMCVMGNSHDLPFCTNLTLFSQCLKKTTLFHCILPFLNAAKFALSTNFNTEYTRYLRRMIVAFQTKLKFSTYQGWCTGRNTALSFWRYLWLQQSLLW